MIVVAGEALIDLIIGPDGSLRAVPGGGPYNAARTLGLLGAECTYLGVLADDPFGETLRSALSASNVKLGCPTPANVPTSLAVAKLGESGTATYSFYLEGTSLSMLSAREAWAGLPDEYDALHVGTLGIVVEPTASVIETLVEEARADHIVMVDPNCRPAVVTDYPAFAARAQRLMRQADLVKVSDDDVAYLFPRGGWDEFLAALVGAGTIVLHTSGPGPIDVYTHDGHAQVLPPTGRVVDTVGAGDIFGATVLASLLEAGWDKGCARSWGLPEVLPAVERGALAAGIACGRAGAEPPTRDELDEAAHRQGSGSTMAR